MIKLCPSKGEVEIQRKGKNLERKNILGGSLVLELIEWGHKN